jgi:ATP-binding cassette subfamily F protein uup
MGPTWKEDQRVIDAVKDIAEVVSLEDGRTISASHFLEHFMFSPEAQYKKIAKLSGGELRRLHLLTVLIRNPNFLILDEPTNDLDLFALNKLEEFLLAFKGCLVVVSHDRYFLDKLTDHLFVFEGGGMIRDHYGSYSDYRSQSASPPDSRKPVKEEKSNRGSKGSKDAPKAKLSFKEQREYEALELEIAGLEEEKEILEEEIGTGKLEYDLLHQKSLRIAALMDLIETKMQRWMDLGQYV